MSDLGSEELEEEGENDLGVRAPGEGGALPGACGGGRTPGGPGRIVGRKTIPATTGAVSWKLVVKGKTLCRPLATRLLSLAPSQ